MLTNFSEPNAIVLLKFTQIVALQTVIKTWVIYQCNRMLKYCDVLAGYITNKMNSRSDDWIYFS
jgi:hypothetical protein